MIAIKVQKKICSSLIYCAEIIVHENGIFSEVSSTCHHITKKYYRCVSTFLGSYSSEERAEEVFNEICEAVAGGQKVYCMPEE